jgi:hypothetical protein
VPGSWLRGVTPTGVGPPVSHGGVILGGRATLAVCEAARRSLGRGSAAVMTWFPAWIWIGAVTAGCLDEPADGPAGLMLDPPADGQGGEHDREVGFDRVALAVVDGPGLQVALGHPEAFLDLEQLVVGADHELSGHGRAVGAGPQVGDVAQSQSRGRRAAQARHPAVPGREERQEADGRARMRLRLRARAPHRRRHHRPAGQQPPKARAAPAAAGKWVTASVTDDIPAVIAAGFAEADRRDPARARTWIALVDGSKQQIDVIGAEAARRGVTVTILIDLCRARNYADVVAGRAGQPLQGRAS